jgi:hypothetical protein
MPLPERFKEIVQLITDGTQRQGVAWATLPTDDGFVASSGSFLITLRRLGFDNSTKLQLRVLDEKGTPLDDVAIQTGDPDFQHLDNVFIVAKTQVDNSRKQSLDALRQQLRKTIESATS